METFEYDIVTPRLQEGRRVWSFTKYGFLIAADNPRLVKDWLGSTGWMVVNLTSGEETGEDIFVRRRVFVAN